MTDHQHENLIDLTFLKEFCNDDHEKMANYIHLFLESAPEQMEAMKSLASSGNWPAVKTAAHTLKPQLAFIGAVNLSPLIEKIEAATISENPVAETPTLVRKLEQLLDQSFNELIQSLVSLT